MYEELDDNRFKSESDFSPNNSEEIIKLIEENE
jgi:hypothetical protein